MSLVREVQASVDLNKVPSRIALYEEAIASAEAMFILDDKRLEEAIKYHAQNLMIYDVMLAECRTIEDTVKQKVEAIESMAYRALNEKNSKALGTRDLVQYIKGDPDVVSALTILNEVVYIRRQLEAIVEALKSMGWSLNNIVKLRVADLEHVTL